MSFNFGGSSSRSRGTSTTQVVMPPRSADETELLRQNIEITRQQSTLLQSLISELNSPDEQRIRQLNLNLVERQLNELTRLEQEQRAFESSPLAQDQRRIEEVATRNVLARLTGEAPVLTPEESKRLDTIYGAAEREGTEAIKRFASESAAMRGLRLTDSPIGREATEQVRRFQENLQATKAGAALNLGEAATAFSQNVRAFQDALRVQAFQNRLALTGRAPEMNNLFGARASAANLARAGLPGLPLEQQLYSERLAGAPQTGRFTGRQTGSYWGAQVSLKDIATVGSALTGAPSTARLKKSILPLDEKEFARAVKKRRGLPISVDREDAYDRALTKVRETPIVRYRYTWEGEEGRAPHIGPLLELSPEEIREDDTHVNVLDYAGMLHAGLKAVDRKVSRLAGREPRKRTRLPLEVA